MVSALVFRSQKVFNSTLLCNAKANFQCGIVQGHTAANLGSRPLSHCQEQSITEMAQGVGVTTESWMDSFGFPSPPRQVLRGTAPHSVSKSYKGNGGYFGERIYIFLGVERLVQSRKRNRKLACVFAAMSHCFYTTLEPPGLGTFGTISISMNHSFSICTHLVFSFSLLTWEDCWNILKIFTGVNSNFFTIQLLK